MKNFKEIQSGPTQHLKKADLHLSLSRKIVMGQGLLGASITGLQQSGKSSYAMLCMYELYQGDLDEMFRHIVFSIKDLTTLLNSAMQNRERMVCVLWDDASVHGSASHYNTDRALVQYLSALGDTLGIATKSLLLTSPSGDLIKAFRQYNFYKVIIGQGRHKYDRVARGYLKGTSVYGQPYYSTQFVDTYDTRLPWYDRYYQMREQLSLSTLNDMHEYLAASQSKKVFTKKGKKYTEIEI